MRGTIVEQNGEYFVEYITASSELDAVERKKIKLSNFDTDSVYVGKEVEFVTQSFYTVGDDELAVIKK